jgi:tetratricopeptide (TPR) repeat protein/DNA-binding winged helix-turn-helix (wHTH) protein
MSRCYTEDAMLDLPHVGRRGEAKALATALANHRLAWVHGPSGIGKTTLVARVLNEEKDAPPPLVVSLAGATKGREIIERTANALDAGRPTATGTTLVALTLALLAGAPRTVVWDDADAVLSVVERLVATIPVGERRWRLVVIAREAPSKSLEDAVPAVEVRPLSRDEALALTREHARQRGRSIEEELVEATRGNPLLLLLALAGPASWAAPRNDAAAALRAALGRLDDEARTVLELLLMAEGVVVPIGELAAVLGDHVRGLVAELAQGLLLTRDGENVALAQHVRQLFTGSSIAGGGTVADAAANLARRILRATPGNSTALLFACRAELRCGRAERALELLREHRAARVTAPSGALERLLRAIASGLADPSKALLLLAREELRWGDYESALATLRDLPARLHGDNAARARLLLAEAYVRAGQPDAARRVLARASDVPALIAGAELDVFRGRVNEARAALKRLERRTQRIPSLEARRAIALASSYLFEESYGSAGEAARIAAGALRAARAPVEPVATVVEILALLGLDQVDRAAAVLAERARGPHDLPMLRASIALRRGDLAGCLELARAGLELLDHRVDRTYRALVARDAVQAAVGLGRFAEAESYLRVAAAVGATPGLEVIAPLVDAEYARLAAARGEIDEARRVRKRAVRKMRGSLQLCAELGADYRRFPEGAARARAALAFADRALEAAVQVRTTALGQGPAAGELEEAAGAAKLAIGWYRSIGDEFLMARALVLFAEACIRTTSPSARTKRVEQARAAVGEARRIAGVRGYVPIAVIANLLSIRVAIDDGRAGIALEEVRALPAIAGDLFDAALATAFGAVGLSAPAPRTTYEPWRSIVRRLELDRPRVRRCDIGDRVYLLSDSDAIPSATAFVVDVAKGEASRGDVRVRMPRQRIALLAQLCRSGATGCTLEELYDRVWGDGTYHPLRHRGVVYVALTRLRHDLAPLATGDVILGGGDAGYRLNPDVSAAVVTSRVVSEAVCS